MPALTKQDLSAAFRDVELCDLLESKGLCPTILRSMLEKLFLRSLVNRLNRESLIEEAKMRGIKNYTRISKEVCVCNCGITMTTPIPQTSKE